MNSPELASVGTPEELFVVNPDAPWEINTDVLGCCITRAEGILSALTGDASDNIPITCLSNEALLGALWAVEGELAQMKTMIHHAIGIRKPEVKS